MKTNLFIYSIFFIVSTFSAIAQNDGKLDTEIISIIRPYDPSVSDAYKLYDYPIISDTSTEKINLKYNITSKSISTSFDITAITPAKIGRSIFPELYRYYIKGGMGNYTSPYLELFANNQQSTKYSYGIHIKHLSINKKINNASFSQFSNNYIDLYAKKFWDKRTLSSSITYQRDVVDFLGGNDIEAWKKTFNSLESHLTLTSNKLKQKSFIDKISASHYFFTSNTDLNENFFNITTNISTPITNELFNLKFSAEYLKSMGTTNAVGYTDPPTTFKMVNQNRLTLNLAPTLITNKGNFNINIGLNSYLDFDKADSLNEMYFYPKVDLSYVIVPDILTTYFGINGSINNNSFKKISKENPYYNLTYKKIFNTHNKIIIDAGLTGALSSKSSFNLYASYKSSYDVPFFYTTDTLSIFNTEKLALIYDTLNTIHTKAEISIYPTNKFSLTTSFELNKHSTAQEEKAWNLPTLKGNISANYTIKKVLLTSTIYYVGKRYSGIINNELHELPNYIDANLSIEYFYSPLFSAFLNINNITNSKYSKWHNYPTQGINIMGGFSYRF